MVSSHGVVLYTKPLTDAKGNEMRYYARGPPDDRKSEVCDLEEAMMKKWLNTKDRRLADLHTREKSLLLIESIFDIERSNLNGGKRAARLVHWLYGQGVC